MGSIAVLWECRSDMGREGLKGGNPSGRVLKGTFIIRLRSFGHALLLI